VQVTEQLSNQSARHRLDRLRGRLNHSEQGLYHKEAASEKHPARPSRRRQRRLSPEQVAALVAAVSDGWPSVSWLASTASMTRRSGTTSSGLRPGAAHPPSLRARFGRRLNSTKLGRSFRKVVHELGVHASTVRQYLIRAGVEPRDRQGRHSDP
jgi:hypothetical protein